MQTISDPRKYTLEFPHSNVIIHQALQVLKHEAPMSSLINSMANILKQENDALINVALNLAPSQSISQLIWQALNQSINNHLDKIANIFAIPLILVVGAKTKFKLKANLDVEQLNQFCTKEQIFNPESDCFISAKLIDSQQLAPIKPSQLYYWARNLQSAKLWLPINLLPSPIEAINEGVFLRFLIGVAINKNGSSINNDAFNQHAMQFMQLIYDQLKTKGVTLFPIPFTPVPLSDALNVGNNYRKEVAIQVSLSNIVRQLRQNSLTPRAIIEAENEAIKLTITSQEPSQIMETCLWQLNRFDDFNFILTKITNILHDVQVKWSYATKVN